MVDFTKMSTPFKGCVMYGQEAVNVLFNVLASNENLENAVFYG